MLDGYSSYLFPASHRDTEQHCSPFHMIMQQLHFAFEPYVTATLCHDQDIKKDTEVLSTSHVHSQPHKTVHTIAGCLLFYCPKQLPMPLSTSHSRQSMEEARTWLGFLMNFCTLLCILRECCAWDAKAALLSRL